MRAALSGRDVLVVMPTGAGKSLMYQLPALLREDLSIVVSPLVALMRTRSTRSSAVDDRVELINAQQDVAANRWALERALTGRLRLLYVAPERFSSPGFAERIREADVGLFVVDEAHCVSQWGHDFRPDYFRLADAARYVGARALVASTATATPRVAADIVARLGLRDPVKVATGFDRPNLAFSVVPSRSPADKARRLAEALRRPRRAAGHRLRGHARGLRGAGGGAAGRARGRGGRLPRRPRPRRAGRGPAALHGRRGRGRGRHQRLRHGRGQGRRAHGRPRHRAAVAGGLLPGGGPRRPRRRAGAGAAVRRARATRGCTCTSSSGRGSRTGAFEAVGRIVERSADADGRYDVPVGALARAAGPGDDSVRAVLGHLVRAGVLQPAPAPPDRAAGRVLAPFDRRALAHLPHRRQRGRAGALARVPHDLGATSRSSAAAARPSSATSAIRRSRCRAARAATSATPRRCRPRRSRRRWSPAAPRWPTATSTPPSSRWSRTARPAVGRTRTVEILRGGRSQRDPRPRLRRPARLRHLGHLRADEVLGRVDAMLADGRLHSTGGRFPKLAA